MIRAFVLFTIIFSVVSLQVVYRSHFSSTPLNLDTLRSDQLSKHNQYRALHGCPRVTLNATLNTVAENYAAVISSQHKLAHSLNSTYGENLYYAWGSPSVAYKSGQASISWYSEAKNYNYSTAQAQSGFVTGHFTAMIWKSVTSVGFGYSQVAENGGYAVYVVANYWPVPNVLGKYAANIPALIAK